MSCRRKTLLDDWNWLQINEYLKFMQNPKKPPEISMHSLITKCFRRTDDSAQIERCVIFSARFLANPFKFISRGWQQHFLRVLHHQKWKEKDLKPIRQYPVSDFDTTSSQHVRGNALQKGKGNCTIFGQERKLIFNGFFVRDYELRSSEARVGNLICKELHKGRRYFIFESFNKITCINVSSELNEL